MMTIYPMLADSLDDAKLAELWGKPNWVCEEKLDGSRYILQYDDIGFARLTSRKISVKDNKPVEKTENLKNYVVRNNVKLAGTILDGEILGGNSFGDTVSLMGSSPIKAQEKLKAGFKVRYVVYDILFFNGEDLQGKPWHYRRGVLKAVLEMASNPYWELVQTLPNDQKSFQEIVAKGGEGVILKEVTSVYSQGQRVRDWVKVKKTSTFEAVIIGFNRGTGKYSSTLGNLVLGQYMHIEGQEALALTEVATISGMSDEQRHELWNNQSKYINTVVEFKAQQKTDSRYRHPQFLRFRDDKPPTQCLF